MPADDDELHDYLNEQQNVHQHQMMQETPPERCMLPSVLDSSGASPANTNGTKRPCPAFRRTVSEELFGNEDDNVFVVPPPKKRLCTSLHQHQSGLGNCNKEVFELLCYSCT